MNNYIYYSPCILDYKDFNRKVKDQIHERDGNRCQLCHSTNTLNIHHINYNKEDSHPFNLITLCRSCHVKTLNHKNDWLRMFSERMELRFGKEYQKYLKDNYYMGKYPKRFPGHNKNGPVTTIKPSMRCDICNQSFLPSLTLQHTHLTNHNSWTMTEQLPT